MEVLWAAGSLGRAGLVAGIWDHDLLSCLHPAEVQGSTCCIFYPASPPSSHLPLFRCPRSLTGLATALALPLAL